MKMKRSLLLLPILWCSLATAQVKIGDNPQNIGPASLLELESTDRVLVITRVTTAQMDAITPSRGGLVYNTEEDCLFYHNGQRWINLCEALGLSFTAEAIVNDFPTIAITRLGDTVNFEVGQIRGENIVDRSIRGNDIGIDVVDQSNIAPDAIGTSELADNAVTPEELDLNLVTLGTFTNDVGYLTSVDLQAAAIGYDPTASGLVATNVQEALDVLDTNVDTIGLVPLGDGTYEFTDGAGISTVINTNGLIISGTIAGNPIAILTSADASSEVINETITSLSDNGDGAITFTGEDGLPQTVAKANLTTPGNGAYTFTNNDGTDLTFDLNAAALPFNNATNGFAANSVQEAIEEVQNGSSDNQDLANVLAQGNDAGGVLIRNILDPELAQDAATRAFVEEAIIDLVGSGEGDAPNEYNVSFAVVGDSLVIRDAQTSYAVGLNQLDLQDISTDNTPGNISIDNGSTLILNVDDADSNPANENQTVSAGTGIIINQIDQNFEVINDAPDQEITLADGGSGNVTIGGGYPNFTIDVTSAIPTGTPGSIFFSDGAGSLVENNAQLFWDNLELKLYVGNQVITDSDVKLNVGGTIRTQFIKGASGSSGLPTYRFNDNQDTGMYLEDASGILAFSTNNIEALRIDNIQNVGIQQASPSSALHLGGSFATPIRSEATNVTLTEADHTVILETGVTLLTLPPADISNAGRIYIIKNKTGVNVPTNLNYLDLNGIASNDIAPGVIWLQSDGIGNWEQIN
ncbi:hypothetical protein [Robiginitalea marina]|uniref:Uncharacterized protein n=1 Tax=Robiginitalea marina TaxID=2954105 RepID=A0ABT1AZQ2_9FLAO|nr:hypothetical protein [Robiginitalea marina]MCO5724823.1 hypothetical protein [Robiginitalea marina]